jgi:hypothetical protein
MKMPAIRKMAQGMGIRARFGMRKGDLIREIQSKEQGSFPCFGTATDSCDQAECLWRSDCLSAPSEPGATA